MSKASFRVIENVVKLVVMIIQLGEYTKHQ